MKTHTIKTHTITLAIELAGGSLPTEFRIFAGGENPSTKGTFLFDEQAAKAVIEAYKKHGITRLPIDYEHRQLQPDAPVSEQVAAGSFIPEVREPDLWATNVRWTPRASRELQDGERMYFSPAFECDPKTKRIRRLVNIALTNLPALDGIAPLVAAKAVPYASGPIDESQGWDGAAAERSVRAWATDADGNVDWGKYRQAFAWYDDASPESAGSYKLGHHEVQGDRLVVSRAGVIAAAAALSGSRGGVDLPDEERDAVLDHIAKHYTAMNMTPPWEAQATDVLPSMETAVEGRASAKEMSLMDKTILTVLSLKEDAPATEVLAAISRMRDERIELLKVAGVESVEAFKGAIMALRTAADRVPVLEQELVALKTKDAERERDAFIEAHKQKFAPAMRDWAKTQSMESLRAFVAVQPDLVKLNQETAQPPVEKVELTEAERRIARAAGMSEADFAAHKALLEKEGV